MQKTPTYQNSRTAVALMAVAAAMPAMVTVANAGDGFGSGGLAQPLSRKHARNPALISVP